MKNTLCKWSAIVLIASLLLAVSLSSHATEPADDYGEIRATISRLIPGLNNMEIKPSAVENMLEVRADINVFYVSSDGRFLMNGPLHDLESGENLTEKRLAEYRKTLLEEIPAIQPVEFPAENAEQKIVVITDVDCGYCRRLHQNLDQYHQAGLDIEYVMLPRAGKDSPSYVKTVNAVCAAQPGVAITAAMNGETPAPAKCDHPVDQHMKMARALGASSTPNIVLPDGRLIRGYQTADQLNKLMAASTSE